MSLYRTIIRAEDGMECRAALFITEGEGKEDYNEAAIKKALEWCHAKHFPLTNFVPAKIIMTIRATSMEQCEDLWNDQPGTQIHVECGHKAYLFHNEAGGEHWYKIELPCQKIDDFIYKEE